jgi:hypothetical protein
MLVFSQVEKLPLKTFTPKIANKVIIIIAKTNKLNMPGKELIRDWTAMRRPGFF